MRLNLKEIGLSALLVVVLLPLTSCTTVVQNLDSGTPQLPVNSVHFTGRWQILSLSTFAIQTAFNLTIDIVKVDSCTHYRCNLSGYVELSSSQSLQPNPVITGIYFYRDGIRATTTGFAILSVEPYIAPGVGERSYVIYVDIGHNTDELLGYYQEFDPKTDTMQRSSQIKMLRL